MTAVACAQSQPTAGVVTTGTSHTTTTSSGASATGRPPARAEVSPSGTTTTENSREDGRHTPSSSAGSPAESPDQPAHSAPPDTGDDTPVHLGDPSGLALLKQAPEWIVGTWHSPGHTVTVNPDGSGTLSVDATADGKTIDLAFQLNSVDGTRRLGTAVAQIMSVGPRNTYRGLSLNSKVTFTFTDSVVTDSLTENTRAR